ncbi:hypothetical protein H0H81_000629 [Sphagnurus paluster]|uniref:ATP-dependent rRNA helicase RRP3 n=1 Tax=Sphagnurus paluster TaxID=117069 RepID=A0A9P7K5V8_9AGAR|nr:hypothetical protein H0H81_000629 [Sphagnurus paluster]
MAGPEDASTSTATFQSLGLIEPLLQSLEKAGYKKPTDIQTEALPHALAGRDIIGVASTGSGKTAAFALPILQKLWEEPKGLFACVLAPTRELAYQISEQFEALGAAMGVRCAVIIGGVDTPTQAIALAKRPHIIVATPGRLVDHLENTKGFNLRGLKFLADRLLDVDDFGLSINKILKLIPKERTTYLFSATMSSKVEGLKRASLSNPVRVQVSSKYQTVSTLLQYHLLMPIKDKEAYLVYLANTLAQNSMIVFTRTVKDAEKLAEILRALGFPAVPLYGTLSQTQRLGALNKFKSGARRILVATDIASWYITSTVWAGPRAGKAITLVTQYDVELVQRIEAVVGKQMELWLSDPEEVALLKERVSEASRVSVQALREKEVKGGKKRRREEGGGRDVLDRDDDVVEAGMPRRWAKKRG